MTAAEPTVAELMEKLRQKATRFTDNRPIATVADSLRQEDTRLRAESDDKVEQARARLDGPTSWARPNWLFARPDATPEQQTAQVKRLLAEEVGRRSEVLVVVDTDPTGYLTVGYLDAVTDHTWDVKASGRVAAKEGTWLVVRGLEQMHRGVATRGPRPDMVVLDGVPLTRALWNELIEDIRWEAGPPLLVAANSPAHLWEVRP